MNVIPPHGQKVEFIPTPGASPAPTSGNPAGAQEVRFRQEAMPTHAGPNANVEFHFIWPNAAVRLADIEHTTGFMVHKIMVGKTEYPNTQGVLQMRVSKNTPVVVVLTNLETVPKNCKCVWWTEEVAQIPDPEPIDHVAPVQPALQHNTGAPLQGMASVVTQHGGGVQQSQVVSGPGATQVGYLNAPIEIMEPHSVNANSAPQTFAATAGVSSATNVVPGLPTPSEASPVSVFGADVVKPPPGKTIAEVATPEQAAEILRRTIAQMAIDAGEEGEWAEPVHSNVSVVGIGGNGVVGGSVSGGGVAVGVGTVISVGQQGYQRVGGHGVALPSSGVLGSGFGNQGLQGGVHHPDQNKAFKATEPVDMQNQANGGVHATPQPLEVTQGPKNVFQANLASAPVVGSPVGAIPQAQAWTPAGAQEPQKLRDGQTVTFLGRPHVGVGLGGEPIADVKPGEAVVHPGEVGVTVSRETALKVAFCMKGGVISDTHRPGILAQLERSLQQPASTHTFKISPGMNEVVLALTPFELQCAIESVKGNDQKRQLLMQSKFEDAANAPD